MRTYLALRTCFFLNQNQRQHRQSALVVVEGGYHVYVRLSHLYLFSAVEYTYMSPIPLVLGGAGIGSKGVLEM